MKFRQALIEYSLKYGVTKAAIRYKTNRQYVYRWRKRYDGTIHSLADKSHKPHSHPNQHTESELKLISDMRRRNPNDGLVVFWVKLRQRKYFRYRYVEAFEEHSSYSSAIFLEHMLKAFKFPVECVQTDNGAEFTKRLCPGKATPTMFENQLKKHGIEHKLIRPYTPRHNGKVERSHRKDNEYSMSAPPTRIINIDNFIFPQPCHNTIINITQCNTRYNIKNANKSTKSYVLQTNLIYKTLSSNLKEISFTTYQKYRSLTTTVFFYCLYTKTNTDPSRLSDV